ENEALRGFPLLVSDLGGVSLRLPRPLFLAGSGRLRCGFLLGRRSIDGCRPGLFTVRSSFLVGSRERGRFSGLGLRVLGRGVFLALVRGGRFFLNRLLCFWLVVRIGQPRGQLFPAGEVVRRVPARSQCRRRVGRCRFGRGTRLRFGHQLFAPVCPRLPRLGSASTKKAGEGLRPLPAGLESLPDHVAGSDSHATPRVRALMLDRVLRLSQPKLVVRIAQCQVYARYAPATSMGRSQTHIQPYVTAAPKGARRIMPTTAKTVHPRQ